jgi:hypothetical protein
MNGNGWCSANASSTNPGGAYLNFDLAFPSPNGAIPSDWFPSNESFYGFTDFGVWNVTFEQVSCVDQWAGGKDGAALGSVEGQGPESVCCPKDPLTNSSSVCPSYSDANGIAYVFFLPSSFWNGLKLKYSTIRPDTTTTGSAARFANVNKHLGILSFTLLGIWFF